MTLEERTVPCMCCDIPTTFTGSKVCLNCWEIITRIDPFLSSEKGLSCIIQKIKAIKVKEWQDKWLKEIDERFSNGDLKTFPLYIDSILSSINDNPLLEVWVEDMEKLHHDPLCFEIIEDAITNKFLWLEV